MGEDPADLAALRRILLALNVRENFPRQYPGLGVKLATAIKKTGARVPGA